MYMKEKESRYLKNQSQVAFAKMEARKIDLEKEIESLKTERGIESEIRSKFNVAKDGEKVIVVIPEEEMASSTPKEGFFGKFINFFK